MQKKGDPDGWDQLLEQYGRLIWSIARRSGLDADESEEVFQRTWVAIVDGIGRIRKPERLGSWVATTTRHQAPQFFPRQPAIVVRLPPRVRVNVAAATGASGRFFVYASRVDNGTGDALYLPGVREESL